MKKSELRLIVNLFKLYYSSVFKTKNFRFAITDSKEKTIEGFVVSIKKITKSPILQEDYLKQYFEFQFNHWYKHTVVSKSVKNIQIEWIVGKKAIDRWNRSDRALSSFIVRKNFKTDIDVREKIKKEDYNNILLNLNNIEENEKERFHNTVKGHYNCIINTTLYNHKSLNCLNCSKRTDCKKLLKSEFPKIFKKRGYE